MDSKQRDKLRATLQRQHGTAWSEYHMLVQDLKQLIPADKQQDVMSIVTRMADAQGRLMVADYRYKETFNHGTWTS